MRMYEPCSRFANFFFFHAVQAMRCIGHQAGSDSLTRHMVFQLANLSEQLRPSLRAPPCPATRSIGIIDACDASEDQTLQRRAAPASHYRHTVVVMEILVSTMMFWDHQ